MSLRSKIALWFAKRKLFKYVKTWLETAIGRALTRKEKAMLKKWFLAIFGTSWQTTLFGWLATVIGVTSTVGWFGLDGKPNWGVIAAAIMVAIFSRQVKDRDVTGGTRPAIIK